MQKVVYDSFDGYGDLDLKNKVNTLLTEIGFWEYMTPGKTVAIKPNLVVHEHPRNLSIFSIITHPTLIRAVYELVTARGNECVIADSPQYNCDLQKLIAGLSMEDLHIQDLRPYWCNGTRHWPSNRIPLKGDPKGSTRIDIDTLLNYKEGSTNYYGAYCDRRDRKQKHGVYSFSNTIWNADILLSMPKLKTHKKVGATLGVKNLVGALSDKTMFPHYTIGPVSKGGDQYPPGVFTSYEEFLLSVERWSYDNLLSKGHEKAHKFLYEKIFHIQNLQNKKVYDAGNWYGNDTCWRAVADLARIFNQHYFCRYQRVFTLIDGIVAGEGDGPLDPDPINCNIVIAGNDLMLTDLMAVQYMGFDIKKIPLYRYFYDNTVEFLNTKPIPHSTVFRPHIGWRGHIEQKEDNNLL